MDYVASEFDSPIEFTIVGPYSGRDIVLARSKGAGIDLIGLSVSYVAPHSSDTLATFFPQSRQVNSIRASYLPDVEPSKDSRSADIVLSWSGVATQFDYKRISRSFNFQAPEIVFYARNGDKQSLEMAIAPVVLLCSQANEKRLKSRRLLVATFYLYIAMGVLGVGFAGIAWTSKYILPFH